MITALLAQIWPYLLAAVGAVAAVLGFGASQRAAGRQQEQAARLQEAQEARRNADAVAEKIASLDDRAVLDAAHKWVRGANE
ncbi:MAG: hypothetical protein EPN31_07545 [Castellaniella sp.]|uniref:hypothetical protein n=1 Tax=Castellaniella sp. TaxID=1955812 RepID=UPI00120397E1|nr:hypothetical protein [Castellaniella sp.]TAN28854.1 MAG: hypothetical protein EPN31_07545 [Castellaniella sp.]